MICVAAALIVMQRNHQLSTPSRRGDELGWKIAPKCSEPWDEVRVFFFHVARLCSFFLPGCGSFFGRYVFCLTGGEEEKEGGKVGSFKSSRPRRFARRPQSTLAHQPPKP